MKTLTTRQAAELLGYRSTAYLNQLLNSGLIEGQQDSSGKWLVSKESVEAFKANKPKPDKRPRIVNAGFTASNATASRAEIERNRALLAEKMARAKSARLIKADGSEGTIRRGK